MLASLMHGSINVSTSCTSYGLRTRHMEVIVLLEPWLVAWANRPGLGILFSHCAPANVLHELSGEVSPHFHRIRAGDQLCCYVESICY